MPLVCPTDTGLITADARTYCLRVAAVGFVWHLWVTDQCARHAAQVCITTCNNLFGNLRLVYSAGNNDRYINLLFYAFRTVCYIRMCHTHRWCDVY